MSKTEIIQVKCDEDSQIKQCHMDEGGLIIDCTEETKRQESVVKLRINARQRNIQTSECSSVIGAT